MKLIGIACINVNNAIGTNNGLLFNIKKDTQLFRQKTTHTDDPLKKNAVLMGRKTFYSIPKKYRPLENRLNIIISNNNYTFIKKDHLTNKNMFVFNTIKQSIQFIKNRSDIETLYIIGGRQIYKYFIDNNYLDEIYISEVIYPKIDIGTVFFPAISNNYKCITKETYIENNVHNICNHTIIPNMIFEFKRYTNSNPILINISSNEEQYLNLLREVLDNGETRITRNSKTISQFGLKMTFDIEKGFPLLTTKKMFWKGIVEELLWFINGKTNSKELTKKGVKIWDKNSSREYLDHIGLNHYRIGWCGPIYGFQWRHFNAEYNGPNADYTNKGIDQLKECINLIKNNPTSRRIFMTGWNPCQIKQMVLPPCHVSYQFYVTSENRLDCQMYQRSGDLFLGVPFNIASTALLTSIIAKMTDLIPGKIHIIIGDGHIYMNHIDQVNIQLSNRTPYMFPNLKIHNKYADIEDYNYSDFELQSYYSHPYIKGHMIA